MDWKADSLRFEDTFSEKKSTEQNDTESELYFMEKKNPHISGGIIMKIILFIELFPRHHANHLHIFYLHSYSLGHYYYILSKRTLRLAEVGQHALVTQLIRQSRIQTCLWSIPCS